MKALTITVSLLVATLALGPAPARAGAVDEYVHQALGETRTAWRVERVTTTDVAVVVTAVPVRKFTRFKDVVLTITPEGRLVSATVLYGDLDAHMHGGDPIPEPVPFRQR